MTTNAKNFRRRKMSLPTSFALTSGILYFQANSAMLMLPSIVGHRVLSRIKDNDARLDGTTTIKGNNKKLLYTYYTYNRNSMRNNTLKCSNVVAETSRETHLGSNCIDILGYHDTRMGSFVIGTILGVIGGTLIIIKSR
jgi:hypothetical protein